MMGVYGLFRRFVSILLIVTLSMVGVLVPMQGALATTITAQEALFGNGTSAAAAGNVQAEAQTEIQNTEEPAAEEGSVDEEVYGENDTASINDYPTLQLGDRDSADGAAYIVMLQNRLKTLGFLQDAADGAYGENTQTAVDQFQKLNGLERTGVADPETQKLLFSDMSSLTTPSPDNEVAFGSEAIRVQTKLVEWGFLDGSVDGKLGKSSSQAIVRFKKYVNKYNPVEPTPTPVPTPTPTPVPTLAPGEMPVVIDIPLATLVPEATPVPEDSAVDELLMSYIDGERTFTIYRETVQNGSEGDEVHRVQTRLNQLGYLYDDADGAFGNNTLRALMYFQRKHGLTENGIADEATQRALFSGTAQKSEEYVFPYKLVVDISSQKVGAFGWDGEGYNLKTRLMTCSTGKDETPTPTGTYQAYGRMSGEWFYFKEFNCYAKWAYGIVGGILFHSVTYSSSKKLNNNSVRNLGRKASHGCVRLAVEDAKWIYENCPNGTTVVIQQ